MGEVRARGSPLPLRAVPVCGSSALLPTGPMILHPRACCGALLQVLQHLQRVAAAQGLALQDLRLLHGEGLWHWSDPDSPLMLSVQQASSSPPC